MRTHKALAALALAFGLLTPGLAGALYDANQQTVIEELTIRDNGRVFIDGKGSRKPKLDLTKDRSIVRYKVVDHPVTTYREVIVRVTLPRGVTTDEVKPTFYAVHSVGSYETTKISESQLEFRAQSVGTDATLTVIVELPDGALKLGPIQRAAVALDALPLAAWLTIAIIGPFLMLVFGLTLVLQRLGDLRLKPVSAVVTMSPSTLPPAFVGTLIRGYVGPREIAATLVDLAHRGYIDIIYQEDGGFSFSRKRDWTKDRTLLPFERLFLDQLVSKNLITNTTEISTRLNEHIWSDNITEAVNSIYMQMANLGYFQGNPKQTHMLIRAIGVTIFFLSIAGLAFSLLYVDQQPFVVLPWIVSLAVTPFMIRLSLLVPRRTAAGRDAAARWLAFRNYLQTAAIDYSDQLDAYEHNLAYAIALGVEMEWTKHFANLPCRVPDWFFSQGAYIDS